MDKDIVPTIGFKIVFKRYFATILICLLINLFLFLYTVKIREPWFGVLGEGDHIITSETLIYVRNWWNEGPWDLNFAMIRNPRSVEMPTISSRHPYVSYPSGAIVPIFLLGLITRSEPDVPMIMRYNLFCHFITSFLLCLTILILLRRMRLAFKQILPLSVIPAIILFLMPGPLYWFQNLYFANQAVLPIFALYLFFEVLGDNIKTGKYLRILRTIQAFVMFAGVFTDYLFLCLALVVYVKRMFSGQLGKTFRTFLSRSILFSLPVVIAILTFLLQIKALGMPFSALTERFMARSGIAHGNGASMHMKRIFFENIPFGYGQPATYILFSGALFVVLLTCMAVLIRFRRKSLGATLRIALEYSVLFLLPFCIYIFVLKQQSAAHQFVSLYFALPLSVVCFVLMPVGLLVGVPRFLAAGKSGPNTYRHIGFPPFVVSILCITLLLSAIIYTHVQHHRYQEAFPRMWTTLAEKGDTIRGITGYEDVVFSNFFAIEEWPPLYLSHSMKRVYKRDKLEEIAAYTTNIKANHNICFLTQGEIHRDAAIPDEFLELTYSSFNERSSNVFKMYQIHPLDFDKVLDHKHFHQQKRLDLAKMTREANTAFRMDGPAASRSLLGNIVKGVESLMQTNPSLITPLDHQYRLYAMMMLEDYESLIAGGEAALESFPSSIEIGYLTACGYSKTGRIEQAKNVIAKVKRNDISMEKRLLMHLQYEQNKPMLSWGGLLRSFAGNRDSTLKYFRSLTDRFPGIPEAWTILGLSLIRHGEKAEGVLCVEKGLSLTQGALYGFASGWELRLWIDHLLSVGELQRAYDTVLRGLEHFDRPPDLLLKTIDVGIIGSYLPVNDVIELCDEVLQKTTEKEFIKVSLFQKGRVLSAIGKTSAAREAFEECLNVDPEYAPASDALKALK